MFSFLLVVMCLKTVLGCHVFDILGLFEIIYVNFSLHDKAMGDIIGNCRG